VLKALEAFPALPRFEAPLVEDEDLLRVHAESYVLGLKKIFAAGTEGALDPDTVISEASGEAAYRAAGAVVAATDAVIQRKVDNAFCAVRPPGHHAEKSHAMGFCIFNNIAVGAVHALAAHGLKRVAIIDFDVHHGNGTQHFAETDARVFYASTHQYPFYPGTGTTEERGKTDNVCNVPLPAGSGSADFREAYELTIFPALEAFAPEMLFISAGFDAHKDDPLAQLRLTEEDFYWVTRELMKIAERHAGGRVVSSLEGGYNLTALGVSAAAHVKALSSPLPSGGVGGGPVQK
jgi:acetoin utilization deacetylase AcuC-like enzyme